MSKNSIPHPKPPKPLIMVLREEHNIDTKPPTAALRIGFPGPEGDCSITVPKSWVDSPNSILKALRDATAPLPDPKAAKTVIENMLKPVFDADRPIPTIQVTSKTGWIDGSFVLPGTTFGPKAGQLEFSPRGEAAKIELSKSGSLKNWKAGLQRGCSASSVLVFAIAAAFAALLLPFAKLQESAIFILVGKSGGAKSLASRAGQSVYRQAGTKNLANFYATDTAIDELCCAHNHMLAIVDDAATADASVAEQKKVLGKLTFSATAGKGKHRSSVVQNKGLPNLSWEGLFLASTEETLQEADPKLKRTVGAEVRLIELPIKSDDYGGIFYNAKSNPADLRADFLGLCASVGETIDKNYGVAIEPYIRALIKNHDNLSVIVDDITREFFSAIGVSSGSAETRIARKFALVCAGGRLAARYGIAPWTEKRCEAACKVMFRRTMKLYGHDLAQEMTAGSFASALLKQFKDHPKKFPSVEKKQTLPKEIPEDTLLGVQRKHAGRNCLLVPKDRLPALIGRKTLPSAVIDALKKAKALPFASTNSATTQVTVLGWPREAGRPGFYIFPLEVLRALASQSAA